MPFRDVIGHRPLVRLLSRSVACDTLPPSLLFAGPSGVGKRLTAVATAQALNCAHSAAIVAARADAAEAPKVVFLARENSHHSYNQFVPTTSRWMSLRGT